MNFTYSYRALIITSMLFGILFLTFKSINLSEYEYVDEERIDIDLAQIEEISEEELAALNNRDASIETNRAFNEAEKFISEIESSRTEPTDFEDGKQQQENNTTNSSNDNGEGTEIQKKIIKPSEKKKEESNGSDKNDAIARVKSSKRNTTVSYRLVNRTEIDLPNPVYTCGTYGKVVINIEVSATGKVTKAAYNDASSTTRNECLIDSALDYARQANFTTDSQKNKQLGTITYNFQGQD